MLEWTRRFAYARAPVTDSAPRATATSKERQAARDEDEQRMRQILHDRYLPMSRTIPNDYKAQDDTEFDAMLEQRQQRREKKYNVKRVASMRDVFDIIRAALRPHGATLPVELIELVICAALRHPTQFNGEEMRLWQDAQTCLLQLRGVDGAHGSTTPSIMGANINAAMLHAIADKVRAVDIYAPGVSGVLGAIAYGTKGGQAGDSTVAASPQLSMSLLSSCNGTEPPGRYHLMQPFPGRLPQWPVSDVYFPQLRPLELLSTPDTTCYWADRVVLVPLEGIQATDGRDLQMGDVVEWPSAGCHSSSEAKTDSASTSCSSSPAMLTRTFISILVHVRDQGEPVVSSLQMVSRNSTDGLPVLENCSVAQLSKHIRSCPWIRDPTIAHGSTAGPGRLRSLHDRLQKLTITPGAESGPDGGQVGSPSTAASGTLLASSGQPRRLTQSGGLSTVVMASSSRLLQPPSATQAPRHMRPPTSEPEAMLPGPVSHLPGQLASVPAPAPFAILASAGTDPSPRLGEQRGATVTTSEPSEADSQPRPGLFPSTAPASTAAVASLTTALATAAAAAAAATATADAEPDVDSPLAAAGPATSPPPSRRTVRRTRQSTAGNTAQDRSFSVTAASVVLSHSEEKGQTELRGRSTAASSKPRPAQPDGSTQRGKPTAAAAAAATGSTRQQLAKAITCFGRTHRTDINAWWKKAVVEPEPCDTDPAAVVIYREYHKQCLQQRQQQQDLLLDKKLARRGAQPSDSDTVSLQPKRKPANAEIITCYVASGGRKTSQVREQWQKVCQTLPGCELPKPWEQYELPSVAEVEVQQKQWKDERDRKRDKERRQLQRQKERDKAKSASASAPTGAPERVLAATVLKLSPESADAAVARRPGRSQAAAAADADSESESAETKDADSQMEMVEAVTVAARAAAPRSRQQLPRKEPLSLARAEDTDAMRGPAAAAAAAPSRGRRQTRAQAHAQAQAVAAAAERKGRSSSDAEPYIVEDSEDSGTEAEAEQVEAAAKRQRRNEESSGHASSSASPPASQRPVPLLEKELQEDQKEARRLVELQPAASQTHLHRQPSAHGQHSAASHLVQLHRFPPAVAAGPGPAAAAVATSSSSSASEPGGSESAQFQALHSIVVAQSQPQLSTAVLSVTRRSSSLLLSQPSASSVEEQHDAQHNQLLVISQQRQQQQQQREQLQQLQQQMQQQIQVQQQQQQQHEAQQQQMQLQLQQQRQQLEQQQRQHQQQQQQQQQASHVHTEASHVHTEQRQWVSAAGRGAQNNLQPFYQAPSPWTPHQQQLGPLFHSSQQQQLAPFALFHAAGSAPFNAPQAHEASQSYRSPGAEYLRLALLASKQLETQRKQEAVRQQEEFEDIAAGLAQHLQLPGSASGSSTPWLSSVAAAAGHHNVMYQPMATGPAIMAYNPHGQGQGMVSSHPVGIAATPINYAVGAQPSHIAATWQ